MVEMANNAHGFQVWRRLFEDNCGSGDMVELAGIEVLRGHNACTKISEISAHMGAWKARLDTYGTKNMTCPGLIRSMFLNIVSK